MTTTTLRESPSAFASVVLGVELHAGQRQFVESRARVNVAACGRRWGKSYAEAVKIIYKAVTRPETTHFLFAPTADQSRIIVGYIDKLLRHSPLQEMVTQSVKAPFPAIHLANGSSIHARTVGNTGSSVRGHGADSITVDEAAFVPISVLDEVIPPMLAQSQWGELDLISSPFGLNRFHDYYMRGEMGEPEYASFRFPSSQNPHLSRSYLEQQQRDMTRMAFEVEYLAQFAEDQNAVFPVPLIQSCLAEISPERQPAHRYVIGWDPAQYNDRSGVAVLDMSRKPWQIVRCFDISGRDYPVQEGHIKALHTDFYRAFVLLDATSHAPVLQHLNLAGVQAEGFTFTNTSKRELIDGLVLSMEQGEVQFGAEPALIDELKYYRYELTKSGNVKLGADEKHHDDLVTAVALAVHAAKLKSQHGPSANRVAVSAPRPIVSSYQPR